MKVYFIGDNSRVMEIEHSLNSFYKVIGCEVIDIVPLEIEGELFAILVDDEGFLKDEVTIRCITAEGKKWLAGNLIICRYAEDTVTSIRENDIPIIEKYLNNDILEGV